MVLQCYIIATRSMLCFTAASASRCGCWQQQQQQRTNKPCSASQGLHMLLQATCLPYL
jgi:hypothetical protein